MNQPIKPSDPTPAALPAPVENPWDDMDVQPIAPSKEAYQAGYLYANKGGDNGFLGFLFAWLGHKWSFPAILLGIAVLGGISLMNWHTTKVKREAAEVQAMADMVAFNKARAVVGFERVCIQTKQKNVPVQFYSDCKRIKADAKAKGVTP